MIADILWILGYVTIGWIFATLIFMITGVLRRTQDPSEGSMSLLCAMTEDESKKSDEAFEEGLGYFLFMFFWPIMVPFGILMFAYKGLQELSMLIVRKLNLGRKDGNED